MRTSLILSSLACMAMAFTACSNDISVAPPEEKLVQVTFNVNPFNINVEPMASNQSRALTRSNASDVVTRIDYIILNTSTNKKEIGSQTLADEGENFGEIQMWLPKGNYRLNMVAVNETYDEGRYSFGLDRQGNQILSALNRDVFGIFDRFAIDENTQSFDVTLNRIVGKVVLHLIGDVPPEIKKIKLVMQAYYEVRTDDNRLQQYDQFTYFPLITNNCVSEWSLYLIPQNNATMELTLLDNDDVELGTTSVKFNIYDNRRTIIEGNIRNVLNQTPFNITINDTWGNDYNVPL